MSEKVKAARIMMFTGPEQAGSVAMEMASLIQKATRGFRAISTALEKNDLDSVKQVAQMGAEATRIELENILDQCSVLLPPDMLDKAMELKDRPDELGRYVKDFITQNPAMVDKVTEMLMMSQMMQPPPKEQMH